jgi:hypothetical protein
MLIVVEHPARATSLRCVRALFRALGDHEARLQGVALRSADDIDTLMAACPKATEVTISFERGTFTPAAFEHLRDVVTSAAGYVDVQAAAAHLRVWTDAMWISTRDSFEKATPRAEAFEAFRANAGGELVRGHVAGPANATLAPLAALLRGTNARVSADLELEVSVACEIAPRFERACFDRVEGLGAEVPVYVTWPGGAIATHMLYPAAAARVAQWNDAVAGALPVRWTTLDGVRAELLERAKGPDRRQLELFVTIADPAWLERALREIVPLAPADDALLRRALAIRSGHAAPDRGPVSPPAAGTRPARLDVVARAIAAEATRATALPAFARARDERGLAFARVVRRVKGGWSVRVGVELDGRVWALPGFLPLSAASGAQEATTIACTIERVSRAIVVRASAPSAMSPPDWVARLANDDAAAASTPDGALELDVLCASPDGAAIVDDLMRAHPASKLVRRAWCRCHPIEGRRWLMALAPDDDGAALVASVSWPTDVSSDPAFVEWGLAARSPAARHWAARRAAAVAADTPAWRATLTPLLSDDDLEVAAVAACLLATWGEPAARRRVAEIAVGTDRSFARRRALEWLVRQAAEAHVELFAELLDRGREPRGALDLRLLELPAEGLAAAATTNAVAREHLFEAVACRRRGLEHALARMVGLPPVDV